MAPKWCWFTAICHVSGIRIGRSVEFSGLVGDAISVYVCVCVHAMQFADFVWQSVERRGTEWRLHDYKVEAE